MGLRADVGKVPVLRATAALRCGDDSATLGTVRSAGFDEAGRWSSLPIETGEVRGFDNEQASMLFVVARKSL